MTIEELNTAPVSYTHLFEKVQMPDSFFDVSIGNVPFGDFKVRDKKYDKNHWLIHDYFFGKTLDKVRPGGVKMCIRDRAGSLVSGRIRSSIPICCA